MTVCDTGQEAGHLRAMGLAADTVLALGLLAVVGILAIGGGLPARPVGLLVGAAAIGPLVWRRRAPLVVWAVTAVAVLTAIAAQVPSGLTTVPAMLIALYTVASRYPRRVSLVAGLLTMMGLAGTMATGAIALAVGEHQPAAGAGPVGVWIGFALPAAVIGGCWLIGDNVRVNRAYLAELRAKTARVEAERAADLARVAAQERNRIARELHDVVVHHVSVIAVHAGAARMLADNAATPMDNGQAWAQVEATARRALTELRHLLGVLRHGQQPPGLTPPPGLDQLDRLVEQVRQAGLPVRCQVTGDPVPLGTAANLAAYRIVQEALTNVLKHQGHAGTDVCVHYRAGELELVIVSTPSTEPAPQSPAGRGHGLIGMRERVAVLGGELDARPRPDGGFAVTAHIPLPDGTPP